MNTEKGCAKLWIDNLKNGIVTRGVLLDIPRLKGVPYLEPGTAVFSRGPRSVGEAGRCEGRARDAMLLRTGRWARREKRDPGPSDKAPPVSTRGSPPG